MRLVTKRFNGKLAAVTVVEDITEFRKICGLLKRQTLFDVEDLEDGQAGVPDDTCIVKTYSSPQATPKRFQIKTDWLKQSGQRPFRSR
jgi:hypothetical protein